MIHDVLLSLFHPNKEMLDMYKILTSESGGETCFLHPSEVQLLGRIVDVMRNLSDIENFIETVRQSKSFPDDTLSIASGSYLQAFVSGLDDSLTDYRKTIVATEKRFLQNPHNPLTVVYSAIYPYNCLMQFLWKIIQGISTQRLHGCAILQYLHQFTFQCVPELAKAIQIIQNAIQMVFFQQLSQWLIYGKLVDKHQEFFIVRQDTSLTFMDLNSKLTSGSTTIQSKENLHFSQYDIAYELLPQFMSKSLAEDALFIGQTVIKYNNHDQEEPTDLIFDEDKLEFHMKKSFWGDLEMSYFGHFGSLFSKSEQLNLSKLQKIVADMKKYVTENLYQIAKKDSDLMEQLKRIKDLYLLGRGDLFEEFFKECRSIGNGNPTTWSAKDSNRAFQMAAHSLNLGEELEQFSFVDSVPVAMMVEEAPTNPSINQSIDHTMQFSAIKYKVKWPLHLIFSQKIMDRYNELFRFLLRIKRAQHDLQLIWTKHREQRLDRSNLAVQIRNKLMFLIDNLFMYLQVDVIESRFNALLETIANCHDFLAIQSEHNLFQIKVLSHCFLLTTETDMRTVKLNEHEVLVNLEQILQVINVFCENQCDQKVAETQVPGLDSAESLNRVFDTLMNDFIGKLMGLKSGPNGMPLTRLLLRLNFNNNFCSKPVNQ